jgi:TatD DNase family protein
MIGMIDSHCHLADEVFERDLGDVISRAQAAGVTEALCVLGLDDPGEQRRSSAVAGRWPEVRFAAGVHPHDAARFAQGGGGHIERVRMLLERTPRLSALGEIGLDYHYDFSPRETQRRIFAEQVALAIDVGLPIVVHTREAEQDTIQILEAVKVRPLRGVLHCFTGTRLLAEWAIDAGLHVSFAGVVTFSNARPLREIAAGIPVDRLLVETDCPYLAPVPVRGSRNEPAKVIEVARTLARLRGMSMEELESQLAENYARLFATRVDTPSSSVVR